MSPRTLEQLLEVADPAWPELKRRLAEAWQPVEVLPPARPEAGPQALLRLQVGAETDLGAVILHTGGLVVDGGWLRFLGNGSERLQGTVLNWNGLEHPPRFAGFAGALVVAHDVLGGLFAINGGGLPGPEGHAFYLSPADLDWQDLGHGYSALLDWAIDGDLAGFYNNVRWDDWEEDLDTLSLDEGLLRSPQPWTLPGQRRREGTSTVMRMGQLIEAHVRRLKGEQKPSVPPVPEA